MYGTTQPPSLKSRVGSSFGPPGACITPSSDTIAPVMTLLISILRSAGRLSPRQSIYGLAQSLASVATTASREQEGKVAAEPLGEGELDPKHGKGLEQTGRRQIASIQRFKSHVLHELHDGLLA